MSLKNTNTFILITHLCGEYHCRDELLTSRLGEDVRRLFRRKHNDDSLMKLNSRQRLWMSGMVRKNLLMTMLYHVFISLFPSDYSCGKAIALNSWVFLF